MAMTRKHFTALAELVGDLEAGRIPLDQVRKQLQKDVLDSEPTFKPDKWNRHADTQRDADTFKTHADELAAGQPIRIGNDLLMIEHVGPGADGTIEVRVLQRAPRFFMPDELV